jgi:predicted thioesterase
MLVILKDALAALQTLAKFVHSDALDEAIQFIQDVINTPWMVALFEKLFGMHKSGIKITEETMLQHMNATPEGAQASLDGKWLKLALAVFQFVITHF